MPHDPQIMLAFIAGFSPQDIFSAIVKNLPTLVWVLLAPYLLFKNPQGRELLTGMFDEADAFSGIRASILPVMFHLIALALYWMPTAVLPDPDLPTEAARLAWLKERLSPVTGKNLSAALIVCVLPLMLYAVVLFRVQLKRFRRWWALAPALAMLAFGIWGAVSMRDARTIPLWKLDLLVVGNMLLAFTLLKLIEKINNSRAKKISPVWNYLAVIFCLCLQLPLIAGSLEQANHLFETARHTYELHYLILLISVVVVVVAGAWAPNLQPLSPIFVLLGITLFYLLMGDLLGGAFLLLDKNTKIVLAALLAVFGYLMFLHRSHIHDVRLQPSKQLTSIRQNLDAYFEAWWAGVDKSKPGEIPIFLMAAQGGGSRAGYWTSQLANRLNIETGGRFRRHLFAVTSASGGSSGFGATLSMWRYLDEHPALDDAQREHIQLEFARAMFQRNYLSGAFYQVFMGEIGRRIAWFFDKKNFNRNYTQQLDECVAFGEAIVRGLKNGRREPRKPFFEEVRMRIATFFKRGDREILEKWEGHSVPNYPRQPYLSYWYRQEEGNKMDGRLPLFFPVTFNIQTGRSGYPSPVSMDSGDKSVFIDAIDILADAEQKQNLKNSAGSLPMVGASHLSQLFPLLNAYTYIPGRGNFIDGGLFENQGLTLMIRLHDWLQAKIKTLPAEVRDRVKIRVISALNGSIRPENDQAKKVTRISQLSGVMRAAGFSGIEGRTTWWGDYLCERIAPDKPIEFVLQFADSPADEACRVPLGRWLSRASIDLMEERMDSPAIVEKRDAVKRMLGF